MLSIGEARRIALAAQGFDRPRPAKPDSRHIRRAIHQLGLIQIDSVNVLVPAHYFVLFSRLGPYDRSAFDHLVYRRREFTEQWAHEASIVPMETWPLLAHRREEHRVRPWGFEEFLDAHPEYTARLIEEVRHRGPLCAEDVDHPQGVDRRVHESWYGTVPRAVLEAHFGRGALAVADRRPNFSRTFDLAERVVPAEHHGRRVSRADAERELISKAARAHGIATAADLADYYRMPLRDATARILELIEAGDLAQVQVEGWRRTAYLHREARSPRRICAASLLSPFDPVVWYRERAERLWNFEYRIEIYTPAPKRRWGYYVLPFLLGDRLVARVDLKADRAAARLLVQASYLEAGADRDEVAPALARELQAVARWLRLEAIGVVRKGNLAPALTAEVRAAR